MALLGKVCDGLQHPVAVEQSQQVVRACLLPQGRSQTFSGFVVLHSSGTPKESPAAKQQRPSTERLWKGRETTESVAGNLLKLEEADVVFLVFPEQHEKFLIWNRQTATSVGEK